MNYNTILVEENDGIGIIKLNRPDVLNAINDEMLSELFQAVQSLEEHKAIKTIVITGEGKAFIACS